MSLPLLPVARLGTITRDGVTDFLNALAEQYEKTAWALRSKSKVKPPASP